MVCTRGWAIATLMLMGTVMVGIALIAAFARPGTPKCDLPGTGMNTAAVAGPGSGSAQSSAGKEPEKKDFIATNGEEFPWKDLRLPKTLMPHSYDIFLHPNLTR